MRYVVRPAALAFLLLVPLVAPGRQLCAQQQPVRVVLFFSPTCPHCHEVIQDHLPIFFDIYGGQPHLWTDPSVPDTDRSLYLLYNDQLEILLVDASEAEGGRLFVAELASHGIPPEQGSVPRMVFGETVLIGSVEIPSRFHSLMRKAMAEGGLDWPAIQGLATLAARFPTSAVTAADSELAARPVAPDSAALRETDTTVAPGDSTAVVTAAGEQADTVGVTDPVASANPQTQHVVPRDTVSNAIRAEPEPPPTADTAVALEPRETADSSIGSTTGSASAVAAGGDSTITPFDAVPRRRLTMVENLRRDPVGNGLSVVVLLGMVASVVTVAATKRLPGSWSRPPTAILVVAVLGILVASYLSYVETSGAVAVCGPVGDCNTVQQSEYAVLLGLIPVGTLGLFAYVAIIVMWFLARSGSRPTADYAGLLLLATAFLGTLFSIYLTFLEPFVIGATCAWCLASSVAITVLMWLSAGPGRAAWARLRNQR